MQGRTRRGDEFRRRLDDGNPGSNGALGIVLVRLGIAEIGEHAVAHILRDKPAIALDQLGAATMIRADHPVQVFGIEFG